MYNKEIKPLNGLKCGYVQFRDKEHPLSYTDGSVYLHRHIASIKLGRWLTSDEHVHHLDGNKINNEIDNLEVLSKKEHALKHSGIIVETTCTHCGTIFLPEDSRRIYCSIECHRLSRVKNPSLTKEVLDAFIPTTSWSALGKMFGYSDVGIKKRAKALGCINK